MTPPRTTIGNQACGTGARIMQVLSSSALSIRALARTAVFFLKLMPMLPSRPVNWVTRPPLVDKVKPPTSSGAAECDLYRPAAAARIQAQGHFISTAQLRRRG